MSEEERQIVARARKLDFHQIESLKTIGMSKRCIEQLDIIAKQKYRQEEYLNDLQ